ncbi:hypothetical protein PHLGIDRAFT_82021 [Phlebiopsis gigantea 11061_1 CR5-6]|uniref:Zn(2)-C6 fungal-type domain-containing protein n=1 Tax=Phlebiopsis gigantea (strain 11061_1 CR5-6) TaxID=745531 RepID=A0A0C3P2W8_PHLG1|nr:hypothetical protein PHLGIDRAFT_82021 [Phlebiopsis gigantea 11061_1 CR5-6]
MNGHPYQSSPSPFHQPPAAGSPHNGQPSHMGPGIPGAAYPYPVHHAYAAHGYPPYSQYPAPASMVMYGAPGPSHAEQHPQPQPATPAEPSTPPTPAPTTGKRKRKYTHSPEFSPSQPPNAIYLVPDSTGDPPRGGSASAGGQADSKKRTKTQRACDSCRSRKIRCDVLSDADPPECQHCKQYGFDCTFFLPITETRFRKQRLELLKAEEEEKERVKQDSQTAQSPSADNSRSSEVRVFGPTSPAYMLHSSAMISSRSYESYDMRYHHTWDVSSSNDGVIQVHEPQPGELQLAHPKPVELKVEERDVIEKLVNAYFTDIAPMLPVVTREEFIASSPPQPILLYAICLVTAARREVPQSTFDSIRYTVNSLIKQEDILSTASIVNLQALLILSMCGDCHSQFAPNALSALWVRLGAAIRMAQDLGLHRAEAVKQNIELRRRLWVICVILDRWVAVTYGHPPMIDVNDCDARLPSSGDETDLYLDYLARLSLILGRVMKNIYTPAGLSVTTDEALQGILADLEGWRAALPEELQFRGPRTARNAGLLHMLYSCVNMLFWRVFMRISYTCPEHLKFALTVEKWTELVRLTGDSIDWLDANETMYDVWLIVAYCATSCSLVQYHTFARRQDQEAQDKLKKLRDCIRRWEVAIASDHMSARRKARLSLCTRLPTAEIITLLYESTLHPLNPEAPALKPTGGVTVKQPLGGLLFRKDPTRPGGGVFIACDTTNEAVDKHLPQGTIINEHAQDGAAVSPHALPPPQQPQRQHAGAAMVSYAPLGAGHPNVNPAMNTDTGQGAHMAIPPGHVQVLNLLDQAQGANALEQLAIADAGFLEGMPATIFDWGSWDSFFARMNQQGQPHPPHGGAQQHYQPYNSAPPTGPM